MQYSMYLKQLQVEMTQMAGWLLYSTHDMELEKICNAIWEAHKINVSMQWHIIPIGQQVQLLVDQQI